jgi:RimJ/RimL family protein N-acetyltransferase
MLPIQTPRLLLRSFLPHDAAAFAVYRSDPEVAQYQSWDVPYSLADAERFVAQMQQRCLAPPLSAQWNQIAIQLGDEQPQPGALIGDCAFRLDPDDARQATIGVTLATAWQGKGYATEALGALLGALFNQLGLHRVTAICDEKNIASQRLLERVGMRREGHFVQNVFFKGAWGNEFAYAMLRSEWRG